MNFMKTIINSIKYWVNRQIADLNTKLADLNTNVNENFITKDEMNRKMDFDNPVGTGSFSMNRAMGSVVGRYSHAEGYRTTASEDCSHAEGYDTTASGQYSHAEGNDTTASGGYSHAEGYDTTASGNSSHAEGYYTTASGHSSHAEGNDTTASGGYSHAEGCQTKAFGNYSHAEGCQTKASGDYSHVQGKYNIEDTKDKYVHIVGNGSDGSKPSNAHTIDWKGVGWFQGGLKVGGASQDDEAAVEVALKSDILSPRDEFILNSSTEGSTKQFKITIDDDGVLTATEIVESEA